MEYRVTVKSMHECFLLWCVSVCASEGHELLGQTSAKRISVETHEVDVGGDAFVEGVAINGTDCHP